MTARVQRLPFSLDPLLAAAKRRARRRRTLVLAVAVAAVAAVAVPGFELRGAGSVTPVRAKLTVLAVGVDGGGRALFHLRCDPAGGNVAQPAEACAAIAHQPDLVRHPKPFFDMGPNTWYFTISGRLDGKPVHYRGESSWTTQMPLIAKLGLAGPHGQPLRLEPLRHGSVGLNRTRTFAPGTLRPGDRVSCRVGHGYRGPSLAMSVPVQQGRGGYVGATPGVIEVGVRADGAVVATCIARDRMPLSKRGRTRLP